MCVTHYMFNMRGICGRQFDRSNGGARSTNYYIIITQMRPFFSLLTTRDFSFQHVMKPLPHILLLLLLNQSQNVHTPFPTSELPASDSALLQLHYYTYTLYYIMRMHAYCVRALQ